MDVLTEVSCSYEKQCSHSLPDLLSDGSVRVLQESPGSRMLITLNNHKYYNGIRLFLLTRCWNDFKEAKSLSNNDVQYISKRQYNFLVCTFQQNAEASIFLIDWISLRRFLMEGGDIGPHLSVLHRNTCRSKCRNHGTKRHPVIYENFVNGRSHRVTQSVLINAAAKTNHH